MYPMAMPPHYGGGHVRSMHSGLYTGSLLNTSNPASQPYKASASMRAAHHCQPSMYVSPYVSSHKHRLPLYSQDDEPSNFAASSHRRSNLTANTIDNLELPNPTLSFDEQLFEKMDALHLGYIETEDSPHKMEQRRKMEEVIEEYVGVTPHSYKFSSKEVRQILENSVNSKHDFDPHKAACAFDALAQFAANLIVQPWRKEFRELKLYNGFWIHQVASHLTGAESVLELMGYIAIKQRGALSTKTSSPATICSGLYVHSGVLDPDLICRLALDCMVAYCECQCLKQIKEGVVDYGISIRQILQFRQLYVGGVEVSVRHLLYTLRQRMHLSESKTSNKHLANISTSPPPVGVLIDQPTSAIVSPTSNATHHLPTKSTNHSVNTKPKAHKNITNKPQCCVDSATKIKPNSLNIRQISESSSSSFTSKSSHIQTGDSVMLRTAMDSCQVPTAKLIDLDSTQESSNHRYSVKNVLPKCVPQKSSVRELVDEREAHSVPLVSPDAFKPSTLDEHLDASLHLVKNPTNVRPKTDTASSLETWDFVFKDLERKGYVKDIGERGDILNPTESHPSKHKSLKNRSVSINQQLPLNQTKEAPIVSAESPASSAYDNLSHEQPQSHKGTWPCSTCTFINASNRSSCEMCSKSRVIVNQMRPLQSGAKQCANCTLINDKQAYVCSACNKPLTGCSTYI